MSDCKCCYCLTKNNVDNPDYIKGIQFAVDFVEGEWDRLKEGIDRWREQYRQDKITSRIFRSRVEHLENQMKYLGEWHDQLAREGNKSIKIIKTIDWKEYLFGDF